MTSSLNHFNEIWTKACQESAPNPAGAAGELMEALARRIDVEQVQYEQIRNSALFLVDLSSLGFTGMDINVFMVTHPPVDDSEQEAYLQRLREYTTVLRSYGICFHILLGRRPSKHDRLHLPEWHVVRMYYEDLERLFSEQLPMSVLYGVACNQIELSNLNPYNTTKVARGSMFVGRKHELRSLIDEHDRGYVVSGARRIGKTSLLTRAFDELDRAINPRRKLEPESGGDRRRVFFFNGLNWKSWKECARRITHEIEPKTQERVELNVTNLATVLDRQSRRRQGTLLLFFDEFDDVVRSDRADQWRFFKVLAEAIANNSIRVVLAGYRDVPFVYKDRNSPLQAKLLPMKLDVLENKETHALIAPIMHNLGIQIRQVGDFVQRIIDATAGYPFLVQYFGAKLFRMAEKRSEAILRPEDVNAVEDDGDTIDFIIEHFLENTRVLDEVQRIERLCAYLYTEFHDKHFTRHGDVPEPWDEQRFLRELEKLGLDRELTEDNVHGVLSNLTSAAIFHNQRGRYDFAFPLLPKVLRTKYPDLRYAVDRLLRGIHGHS